MEEKDKRRKRALKVFESMRAKSAQNGYMSEEEIEEEIALARQERREKESK